MVSSPAIWLPCCGPRQQVTNHRPTSSKLGPGPERATSLSSTRVPRRRDSQRQRPTACITSGFEAAMPVAAARHRASLSLTCRTACERRNSHLIHHLLHRLLLRRLPKVAVVAAVVVVVVVRRRLVRTQY